jgi:hypothetical protein
LPSSSSAPAWSNFTKKHSSIPAWGSKSTADGVPGMGSIIVEG